MKNFAIGLSRRYSLSLGLGTPLGLAVAYHFTEPELLDILKGNSAESASAGFQFYCYDIFNDRTLNYRPLGHFSGLVKLM
jgi:hypothetical protein